MHYEYWEHSSGEKYLIRLDTANMMTGVCGPLRQVAIPEANRSNFEYNDQPQHMAWIQTHLAEFHNVGIE